jgi:DNA adenine methylase
MVVSRVIQSQKPKPFLKWVGGKSRLLDRLLPIFPDSFEAYFEPFFGGGAAFFALAPVTGQINDINKALMGAYSNVKKHVGQVIDALQVLSDEYLPLSSEDQQIFYYVRRDEYNQESRATIRKTALLIFLNKTCFNGLYRENRKGEFNVPFGKRDKPTICDEGTLRATSKALKYVKISSGSFVDAVVNAKKDDFIYFDPPYYPLNSTSSFTSYSANGFLADDQIKLKELVDDLTVRGVKVALSNSDTPFIRDLYKNYRHEFLTVNRGISAMSSKRGKVSEIVVLNYEE